MKENFLFLLSWLSEIFGKVVMSDHDCPKLEIIILHELSLSRVTVSWQYRTSTLSPVDLGGSRSWCLNMFVFKDVLFFHFLSTI